ncbi:acyl-CoA thioesterase [Hypoxylon texense]
MGNTFHWAPNTTILFPDEIDAFYDATTRWTIYKPPAYSAVIRPGTEADVVQAVKLAGSHRVPFLATGGRHGYTTTLGNIQSGLEIDLSQLNIVVIDLESATMTIGGGATFADVMDPVHEAGFEIPTGSSSCPGMVGATVGAGVGRYSGVYGLIIDSLLSAHLVTAGGRLIEVSKRSNPELFWAIRGAGANFGIITSAVYQLQTPINRGLAVNADFIFSASVASAYFKALQTFNGSLPAELATASVIRYNETLNEPEILANWVYMGPEDRAREIMAPILDINPPIASSVVPWNKIIATAGFQIDPLLCQDEVPRAIYSANVRNLSASTYDLMFQKMGSFYADYPAARSSLIEMEIFPNQAAFSVPYEETAYPWRDALGNMIFLFSWSGDNSTVIEAANSLGRELRDDFVTTSGYPDLSVYINYAYGDEEIEQIYGKDKLPRLAQLKKTWDPNDFFSYNNKLPNKYP